jgi:non-ribosomal peptide synthetase component E (peptide arylation enzyme)
MVEHAEDGFFVSGDDARGEDDGVVLVEGDEAMILDRDG